jgi:hypothetical protein
MADYVQYWAPPRASPAFDNATGPINSLQNGWFKRLAAGDTLWILSLVAAELVIVLRADVAKEPRQLLTHPKYAIRNSTSFDNYKIEFDRHSSTRPYAVPLPMQTLRRLRFHGQSLKAIGALRDILIGPLGSLRELRSESVGLLESLWSRRSGSEWLSVTVAKAGHAVFATTEHRTSVDRRAVSFARRQFERKGWIVTSKELERVGYDLHCERRGAEMHVEVKGTAGGDAVFFMTHGEYSRARRDSAFRLAIVTNALTTPRLSLHSGPSMRRTFRFSPLLYSAVTRG